MAKLQIPITFHAGSPADTTGMKDFQLKLASNGHAIFAKGADNAGIVYEAQEIAKQYPNEYHAFVYRITSFNFRGGTDVPDYFSDPYLQAIAYWDEVDKRWPKELEKQTVYAEFPNEVDKNQSAWLGEFMYNVGLEAIRRGYKYCGPAWSSGEPEPEDWYDFRRYLELCELYPDRLAVSLHEYTLDENVDLLSTEPWLIGRVRFLNMACDEMNISWPKVFITEGGWGSTKIPSDVSDGVGQLIDMLDLYLWAYPNVSGFAIWALDKDSKFQSIYKQCQKYIAPLAEEINRVEWDEKEAMQPVPIPDDKPKIVIVKIPQEYTADEATDIFYKYFIESKRTVTASHDDMLTMLDPEFANSESYAIIIDGWQPSQIGAREQLELLGYNYIIDVHKPDPNKANPLVGLKLGPLFDVRYVLTSKFNDQRDYGLHEGVDFDVVGGLDDNKANVLCMYDGTVDVVFSSQDGYGTEARVKSTNHGNVFYHRYAHLDKLYVATGQAVKIGEPIGEIGDTGNAYGEHVHINLEVPGFGLSGYTVPNVVDPWPYCYQGGYSLPPITISTQYDVYRYIFPDVQYGPMTEVRHTSGATETFQMQLGYKSSVSTEFFLVKNSQWEQFYLLSFGGVEYVCRAYDTSPGGAPLYDPRPRVLRFYKQYEADTYCARWCPRYMRIGEVWHGPGHLVQFYYKDSCEKSPANSGGSTNSMTLVAHYDAIEFNDIVMQDVIKLSNGSEYWYYANGFGMIAWEMPSANAASYISEIHHDRPNLKREAVCGQ